MAADDPAARFGIAANIEFPLPASFIWDMFVRVLKDIPGESAFSKQSMSWKLMTLLPQHTEEDDFILLRQYLSDDGDKRKLFQLAARVADLYDQYLVYRPEWLMRWEAGQRVEGLGDAQQWQAPLWQALVSYTAELGQPQWHRANLYQRFISTTEKRTNRPPGCRRASSSAGFPRCRRSIFRRCRRWVSMSMSTYCLPTPAATTGETWDPAFTAKLLSRQRRHHREARALPCFATPSRRRGCLMTPGNRMSATRCSPPGANWGATISTCWRGWSAMRSWTLLSTSPR